MSEVQTGWREKSRFIDKEEFNKAYLEHKLRPADKRAERDWGIALWKMADYVFFLQNVSQERKSKFGTDVLIRAVYADNREKYDPSKGSSPFFFFLTVMNNACRSMLSRIVTADEWWIRKASSDEDYECVPFTEPSNIDPVIADHFIVNPDRLRTVAALDLMNGVRESFTETGFAPSVGLAIASEAFRRHGGSYPEIRYLGSRHPMDARTSTEFTIWSAKEHLPDLLLPRERENRLAALWMAINKFHQVVPEKPPESRRFLTFWRLMLKQGFVTRKDERAAQYGGVEKNFEKRGFGVVWCRVTEGTPEVAYLTI